jgi:hypothetical protein
MKKIIIHVGAPKCGSSTIQTFLSRNSSNLENKLGYWQIKMAENDSVEVVEQKNHKSIREKLINLSSSNDMVVVSHEVLYNRPDLVDVLCESAGKIFDKIVIVGYARPSSDYIVSEYNQWHFRNKNLTNKTEKYLNDHDISSDLFLGLEKRLIFFILFVSKLPKHNPANWLRNYEYIEVIAKNRNAELMVGLLPNRNDKIGLLEDFCNKISLNLKVEQSIDFNSTNPKFSDSATEMINIATALDLINLDVHKNNEMIFKVSKNINLDFQNSNEFLQYLKNYIDSFYLEDNTAFSEKYHLPINKLTPKKMLTESEVLSRIQKEVSLRKKNNPLLPIYKKIIALQGSLLIDNSNKTKPISSKTNLFIKLKRFIKSV